MMRQHAFLLMIVAILVSGYVLAYRAVIHAQTDVTLTVLGQIPYGFDGSARVTASQPVAVVVNAWRPGAGAGDVIGSYPAVHR